MRLVESMNDTLQTPKHIAGILGKNVDVVRMASTHQRLHLCYGAIGTCLIACVLCAVLGHTGFAVAAMVPSLVIVPVSYLFRYRLAQSLAEPKAVSMVFLALSVFCPPYFVVWLVSGEYEVRRAFRDAGVNCGWLGVRADDVAKLYVGACSSCGYSLIGVEAMVCPECGYEVEDVLASDRAFTERA